MAALAIKSSAVLAAAAFSLAVTPAFARGGGGGHGGGGHSSGGGHSFSSSSHSSGFSSHSSSGSHSFSSAPRSYSAPRSSYSAPRSSYSSGASRAAPHYAAPSVHNNTIHGDANVGVRGGGTHVYGGSVRGPVQAGGVVRGGGGYVGGGYAGTRGYVTSHGYVGGGRGYYAAGGRVPVFVGGRRGGIWWGPHYGWRVPAYWGWYYRPYAGYWGAGYWVTDWVMLDLLAMEEARLYAYGPSYVVAAPGNMPPLDDGVREELRSQVEEDMDAPVPQGGFAAPSGDNTLVVNDPRVARALASPHHVFVVTREIVATDRTHGGTCKLTAADLLRSSAPVPSGQSYADVSVAAAKQGSCPRGAVVSVPIADLVHSEEDLLARVAKGAAAANQAGDDPAAVAPAPGAQQAPAGEPPTTQMPQGMPSSDQMDDVPQPNTSAGDDISF